MNINFSWKFHQKVLTLTITFIVLNDSIEFVLIYRPHPVFDAPVTFTLTKFNPILSRNKYFLFK